MRSSENSIRRALISVSDKTGLESFASGLAAISVEIISTGGTARLLREKGIPVKDVSDVTGFPEILDGRVKTLHPKIHGGLLGLRSDASHRDQMRKHEIEPIDMVVVNLYPFSATIARRGVTVAEAIENIDIGGPSMIRSAAKNFQDVAVLTDASDYDRVLDELRRTSSLSLPTRLELMRKAFDHTARYDRVIAQFFAEKVGLDPDTKQLRTQEASRFPSRLDLSFEKACNLRYGENPHQRAALYFSEEHDPGIARAEKLQGKELSFNNILDADAAWSLACEFTQGACVIIKHTNPCGGAIDRDGTRDAAWLYERALACDPLSAFGGIIAINRPIDERAAGLIAKTFYEVVVAPDFSAKARELLSAKKNLRLLKAKPLSPQPGAFDVKRVSGGLLVQDCNETLLNESPLRVVTARQPTEEEMGSLRFGWTICKHVKSNAIVYVSDHQLAGVGAGQMSRVDSVKFGAMKAVLPLKGTVLASDAFFPFRDGIDEAAKHGMTAVIQPGGSVRDAEVIEAANEHGLAMVFTAVRHFRH